jgi:F0F1-type ATP synthase gamma subunit
MTTVIDHNFQKLSNLIANFHTTREEIDEIIILYTFLKNCKLSNSQTEELLIFDTKVKLCIKKFIDEGEKPLNITKNQKVLEDLKEPYVNNIDQTIMLSLNSSEEQEDYINLKSPEQNILSKLKWWK